MEPLYKIQENATTGWTDVTKPLIKEDCTIAYENLLNEGISPNRLKVVRIQ
jgi:hypothetical protein